MSDPAPPVEARPALRRADGRTIFAVALVIILGACLAAAFGTGNRDLANTLAVGVLSAVSTVVGFYFGSSRSSQAKDETIASLTRGDGA